MGLVGLRLGRRPLLLSKLFIQPWYALHELKAIRHGLMFSTALRDHSFGEFFGPRLVSLR